MAKIIEKNILVKVSQLVKNDDDAVELPEDLAVSLEAVAQELAGNKVIVEVEVVE